MKHWKIQSRIMFMALVPGIIVSLTLGLFFIYDRNQDLDDLLNQVGASCFAIASAR